MIYFIEAVSANRVKIGHAVNIKTRMRSIKTGCPFELELIRVEDGGASEERAVHQRFADRRIQGEWFTLTPDWRAELLDGSATQYLEKEEAASPELLVEKDTRHVDDPLISLAEFARRLNRDRATVWRWANKKLFEFVELPSGMRKIRTSEANRFLEARELATT